MLHQPKIVTVARLALVVWALVLGVGVGADAGEAGASEPAQELHGKDSRVFHVEPAGLLVNDSRVRRALGSEASRVCLDSRVFRFDLAGQELVAEDSRVAVDLPGTDRIRWA